MSCHQVFGDLRRGRCVVNTFMVPALDCQHDRLVPGLLRVNQLNVSCCAVLLIGLTVDRGDNAIADPQPDLFSFAVRASAMATLFCGFPCRECPRS